MDKIGLVGFPNVGKSTFFYTITGIPVQRDLYPFTTVGKNEGRSEIRDELLVKLAKLSGSREIRNFKISVYDIAGIVEGAHKGEGLGNEFLGYIREAEILIFILRAFKRENVASFLNEIDPLKEREILLTELALSDLERVENKLRQKNIEPELKEKLLKAKEKLEKGEDPEDIKDFPLLRAKRRIFVFNCDERKEKIKIEFSEPAFFCPLKIVEELMELEQEDKREFVKELKKEGFTMPWEIIEYAFNLLGYIRFYTLKGEIASAFSLKKGKTAYDAAGKIHTDIQKGFIKVEVAKPFDFMDIPSWKELKEKGKIQIHGPEYVVQDRDILEFKFSSGV